MSTLTNSGLVAAEETPRQEPAFTVEVTMNARHTQKVNMNKMFSRLRPDQAAHYQSLDLAELGFSADWERPVAYLWPDEDGVVPFSLVPQASGFASGTIDNCDVRVCLRDGEPVARVDSEWTRTDYETLQAAVRDTPTFDHQDPENSFDLAGPADSVIAGAALVTEISAEVSVSQVIDLVSYLQGLSPEGIVRYQNMDLAELGFEAEWERPMAFLWPDLADQEPAMLAPGSSVHVRSEITDAQVKVRARNGRRTLSYGSGAHYWTEADYDTLLSHVPWLREAQAAADRANEMTQYERDRIPTERDVPLF